MKVRTLYLFAVICLQSSLTNLALAQERPNVVLIFLDDSGWADFEPNNKSVHYTPNMGELAKEGGTYHNFYVPQAVCSASRAALLTGSYPGRTKIFGALKPKDKGLERTFATMGEIYRENGYRTALFGKWHLGDSDGTRPWDRGFDETAERQGDHRGYGGSGSTKPYKPIYGVCATVH